MTPGGTVMAYMARTRNGVCMGVTLDLIGHEAATATQVAGWIRRGHVVHYASADTAQAEWAATLDRIARTGEG